MKKTKKVKKVMLINAQHSEECRAVILNNNIIDNYITINYELKRYGKNLNKKKELIALSKSDLMSEKLDQILDKVKKNIGITPLIFSSFTKNGLDNLVSTLFKECKKINDK